MYYLIIKAGSSIIFEGSLTHYKTKFFSYDESWSEEKVLTHVKNWVEQNSWTLEYNLLN